MLLPVETPGVCLVRCPLAIGLPTETPYRSNTPLTHWAKGSCTFGILVWHLERLGRVSSRPRHLKRLRLSHWPALSKAPKLSAKSAVPKVLIPAPSTMTARLIFD